MSEHVTLKVTTPAMRAAAFVAFTQLYIEAKAGAYHFHMPAEGA